MKTNQDSFGSSSSYLRMQEEEHLIYFIALQTWLLGVTNREIIINTSCSFLSGNTLKCLGGSTELCSVTFAMNRLRTLSTDPELEPKKLMTWGFLLRNLRGHWLIKTSSITENEVSYLALPSQERFTKEDQLSEVDRYRSAVRSWDVYIKWQMSWISNVYDILSPGAVFKMLKCAQKLKRKMFL